jgi:Zn-dependent oligopeptidase
MQFMELWLTERSTLFALMDFSNSTTPFSEDEVDAAYRVRTRIKAQQLAELLFIGSLELELLSGFDLKGSETVLSLQHRLAERFVSHAAPDSKDLAPLLRILKDNVQGSECAYYRYLWCDVMSSVIFEHFMEALASQNPNTVATLQKDFRRLLLDGGANVQVQELTARFQLDVSGPGPLLLRYGLQQTK